MDEDRLDNLEAAEAVEGESCHAVPCHAWLLCLAPGLRGWWGSAEPRELGLTCHAVPCCAMRCPALYQRGYAIARVPLRRSCVVPGHPCPHCHPLSFCRCGAKAEAGEFPPW